MCVLNKRGLWELPLSPPSIFFVISCTFHAWTIFWVKALVKVGIKTVVKIKYLWIFMSLRAPFPARHLVPACLITHLYRTEMTSQHFISDWKTREKAKEWEGGIKSRVNYHLFLLLFKERSKLSPYLSTPTLIFASTQPPSRASIRASLFICTHYLSFGNPYINKSYRLLSKLYQIRCHFFRFI